MSCLFCRNFNVFLYFPISFLFDESKNAYPRITTNSTEDFDQERTSRLLTVINFKNLYYLHQFQSSSWNDSELIPEIGVVPF